MIGKALQRIFFFFLFSGTAFSAFAQKVTGIWHGYFVTESGDQYKLEFQIAQDGAGNVMGVSYSYLDARFYGKASMKGKFQKLAGRFNIEELKTTEVRNMGGGGTCLMQYKFSFTLSGKEMFLEGTYLGKNENRLKSSKWGDCGGGKVFLRKVELADFPLDSSVAKKLAPKPVQTKKATPAIVKKTITTKKTSPPIAHRTTHSATARTTSPTVRKTTPPVVKTERKKDSVVTKSATVKTEIPPKQVVVPIVTRDRKNETVRVLEISHREVTVRLYDNGEIDDDTVSIYLDNRLLLKNKRLSYSPIEFKVQLDEVNNEHILVMVAENMGRIPPNTSLMVVYDGDKRNEVQIVSTEQKNAMVRLRYKPSE